jgi:hypothetical protein
MFVSPEIIYRSEGAETWHRLDIKDHSHGKYLGHHQEGASGQLVLVSFGGGCIPYMIKAVFNIGRPSPILDVHARGMYSLNTLATV